MPDRPNPSLRFQHDEVKDFHTAMDVYVDQYAYEREVFRELGASYKERQAMRDSHLEMETQIELAKKEYQKIVVEAQKRFAEKLRSYNNATLNAIADAVERNNYSDLAL